MEIIRRVGRISQAFKDVGIIDSRHQYFTLRMEELYRRVDGFAEKMADMTPDELQAFVNDTIDSIEGGEGRKKDARIVLRLSIERYLSERIA